MKISSLQNTKITEVSHNKNISKKVLIDNGQVEHLTNFSQAIFPPNEIAYVHSHSDMTEVFFIQSGAGIITVNCEVIHLIEGMCITIEPNETHELKNTGSTALTVLYFGIQHEEN